jgi:Darcynin, domain of unknown function
MTRQASTFQPQFTVLMLVKADPEWLGLTAARVRSLAQEALAPILKKLAPNVTLGYWDVDFYSALVTDIWIWRTKDVGTYRQLLEDLRENAFWTRHFKVVEILVGVDEAQARNYYRGHLPARAASGSVDRESGTMMQDVA